MNNKKFKTGLVIGKFYPPHKGHKYLIESALAQCDQVTVIVCDKADQLIPGTLRAQWLKEIHPTAIIMRIDDTLNEDDTAAWAENTIKWLGSAPDAVFSSENYGPGYAKAMGSKHIMVDQLRQTIPISGTKVRANPFANWDYLEPPVRAYFTKRICVLGAESTGTTTLSKALAEHYKTVWVPEYGRLFSEGRIFNQDQNWNTPEFTHIAEIQATMEDALARLSNKIEICDTDPFATTLWHMRYMDNARADKVEAIANSRHYDLYILTGDEIPFVQDGLRDGEHIRHWMHNLFEEELQRTGRPYLLVRGNKEQRLNLAITAIDALFTNPSTKPGFTFFSGIQCQLNFSYQYAKKLTSANTGQLRITNFYQQLHQRQWTRI